MCYILLLDIIVLYCFYVLNYIVINSGLLYCIVLYYIVSCCIVLSYIVSCFFVFFWVSSLMFQGILSYSFALCLQLRVYSFACDLF